VTFSAGPLNTDSTGGGSQATVTIPFVVDVGALAVSPCQFKAPNGATTTQTVTIKITDASGDPIPNQSVTAACTVLAGVGDSITATAPLATDSSGSTFSVITATNTDGALIGYCTFTSGSLVQSVGVNTNSCSSGSGGFSPQP
jgi:hypothetical protein